MSLLAAAGRSAPRGVDRPRSHRQHGFLSLELVMTLPVLAVVVSLLFATALLVRDVLVLQEASRVGARVASTTEGDQAVRWAVQDAAPELRDGDLTVRIDPPTRQPGHQVQVEVSAERRYGPLTRRLRASSTARVEPIVEHGPRGPVTPLRPIDPAARGGSARTGGPP